MMISCYDENYLNFNINDSATYNIKREWIFHKILHCINSRKSAKTCGLLILGGSGSGKSTICKFLSSSFKSDCLIIQKLKPLLLASHFCSSNDVDSLNLARFIFNIHKTILSSELFGNAYKNNINSTGICNLFRLDNLCTSPDKAFKNGILLPLLSFSPPSENMFILVDSIDESLIPHYMDEKIMSILNVGSYSKIQNGSKNISDLLSLHHNFFPEWLTLVCTCRKENEVVIRKFMGFRKFYIDDLSKCYVIRDIQLYILNRIDKDKNLKKIVNSETSNLLNLLHIKSNGYIMYLEIVLDGIVENYLNIQVIKHIPGILCGLYLWIFETSFTNYQDFVILKPIFNILLSSFKSLSEREIFSSILNLDVDVELSYIKSLLLKVKYFVTKSSDNCFSFKHNSLPEWLLDVKLCTPKYHCSLIEGHSLLALFYTFTSMKLSHLQIRSLGFHLIASAPIFKLRGYHYIIWLLYSNCDLDIKGILPSDEFGSLYDWNFDDGIKKFFESLIFSYVDKNNALSSFTIFSKYILKLTNVYSIKMEGVNMHSNSLHESIRQNNYHGVSQLILGGFDVNSVNEHGITPLMIAAQHGFSNICRLLLSSGACQMMVDNDGWSALRLSIWNKHLDVVKILLSQRIDPDFTGPDGRTALRTSAWIGSSEITLTLLNAGAEINKCDSEGRTPLMAATYKCDYTMVKLLLDNKANINHQDNDGRSAIFVAALCLSSNIKYMDIIKLLVKYNADINMTDNEGISILLIGAYEGNTALCKLLLENNADKDITDRNSRTPLMAAAFSGNFDVVKLLLFWGASIHCIDKAGFSVLSISASQGNYRILAELLARGLDEMHRDNFGSTPLHISSAEGHVECVNILLKSGAKPNEIDNHGRIPLMLSCQEGHIQIVRKLLEVWPESINFKSFDGSTSLKIAVLNGWPEIVDYLLTQGADESIQDNSGRTSLHVSVLQGQYDCAQIILKFAILRKSNVINYIDEDGRTPFHIAAWKGEEEIIKSLIQIGCQINLKDNEGRSALHLAAWQGYCTICELLINSGTEIDATCLQGATSLSIACQEGHLSICNLLINRGSNVSHVDAFMRTPYKVAFKGNHFKICKLLERNGALVNTKDILNYNQ